MSDFFEPPPPIPADPEPPWEDWMGPPRAVAPGVVPVEREIARTEEAIVHLSGFWVYPAGFEVQVQVLAAGEGGDLDPFGWERDEVGAEAGEIPPGKLRLGFGFADGSKVTNTGADFAWHWESGPRPASPKMSATRGRGGSRRGGGAWSQGLWVWPLPPRGSLQLVCEWPATGVPLTRIELDADPVLAAASRAQPIFPRAEAGGREA